MVVNDRVMQVVLGYGFGKVIDSDCLQKFGELLKTKFRQVRERVKQSASKRVRECKAVTVRCFCLLY